MLSKKKKKNKATIPASHKTIGIDADLVLYLTVSNEPSSVVLAWATACLLSGWNGRPVAGQININLAYLKTTSDSFQDQMDTFLHEVKNINLCKLLFLKK